MMSLSAILLGAALFAFAPTTADAQSGIYSWSGRTYYRDGTFDQSYVAKDKKILASQAKSGIPGKSNCRIRILKLGICGDADRSSGSVKFAVSGSGGAGFSFEAGRGSGTDRGSTYSVSTTYRSSGYTRYDTIKTMSTSEKEKHTFASGAGVTVRSEGSNDGDSLYCRHTGFDGIAINDASRRSTYRALIQFEYICVAPCKTGFYRKQPSDKLCTKCKVCKDGSEFAVSTCTDGVVGGIHSWSGRTYYNQKIFDRQYVAKDKKKSEVSGFSGVPAKKGCQIQILKIGICGDADQSSGSVKFAVSGSGGTGFSFEAGRSRTGKDRGSTYSVSTTYRSGGYTKYDIVKSMSTSEKKKHTFAPGAGVTVKSEGTNDYDCLKCRDTGFDGISVNDGDRCGTFRALIEFNYLCPTPDTVCKTCAKRTSTEHFARSGTCQGSNDAVWDKCKTCKSDEFVFGKQECTSQTDRVCFPHAEKCKSAQYEVSAATKTSDRFCFPRTKCASGQFTVSAGDASSNTLCKWLQPSCVAPLQYEIEKPTSTSDRKCGATTLCTSTEYETVAATATSNRECAALKTCVSPQTEIKAATATTDRTCGSVACFDCPYGHYETRKCNVLLKVEVATLCAPCAVCNEKTEVLVAQCAAGSDTKCVDKNMPSVPARAQDTPGLQTKGGNILVRAQAGKNVMVEGLVLAQDGVKEGMDVYQELVALKLKYTALQDEFKKYIEADQA